MAQLSVKRLNKRQLRQNPQPCQRPEANEQELRIVLAHRNREMARELAARKGIFSLRWQIGDFSALNFFARINTRLAVGIVLWTVTTARAEDLPTTVKAKPQRAQTTKAPTPPAPLRFAPTSLRIPRTFQGVTTMTFSPDGKYLASGNGWSDREGSIQVWEVKSGKRVGLEMLSNGVTSMAWTPDGKYIAASIWDSTVRVYAFPGLQQKTRIAIDRSASRLGLSPDGKQIVTAAEGFENNDDSRGRIVQIWDAATGKLLRKCDSEEDLFRLGCAAWSPKGKYVAAAGGYYGKRQGLGRLWFADTGKEAARLVECPGYIRAIRFFPDDSRVVTAGLDGTLRIWESATGKMVSQFAAGALVDGLDISRDGALLASGTSAGQVSLWNPREEKKIGELTAGGPVVVAVAFSPDGKLLAGGGADAVIRMWNVADRKLERELPAVGDPDRPGRPLVLAPAGDGEFVVATYDSGALRALDVGQQKELWNQQAPQGEFPMTIAVAPDKKHVLVGYEHGAVRLHAAADGAVLLDLKRMPAKISALACADGVSLLAAGDAQGRMWLWDRRGKRLRVEWQDHQGAVLAIGFADEARLVTSIGADGTAICRQTATGEKTAEARVSNGPVASALISADGSAALILGQRLAIWDAVQFTLRRNVNTIPNRPTGLALSSDGLNVLVSQEFGTFVEGPQNGTIARVRVTDSREAGVIALSGDNRVLFQATASGALLVWHALPSRQSPLARIRRVGNAVALATSPDGKWLAAGGDDSQVSIWNLETGEQVESLPGGGGTIYACQFSPDNRLLASATLGGTVKVWGVNEWTLEGSLLNPKRQVRCAAFSPDGRWLATGGSDRTLLVTDTKTWETVAEKPNQDRWVEGIAFSPDGQMLYSVTGSWDPADQPAPSTLSAWSVQPGKAPGELELELVKTLSASANTSDSLVVTPDSRFVIIGSADGRIKVCEAKTLAAIRTIQAPHSVHRIHLLRSDPTQLVVGDHVGGVFVCNIQTGAIIANYGGHIGHVFDVTATIDGRILISAGEDDFLLFWPGPTRGPDDKLNRFLKQAADND